MFSAAVCCGGSLRAKQARRPDWIVRQAGSVMGVRMVSLEDVVEGNTTWTILCMTPLRIKGAAAPITFSLFAAGPRDLGGL